MDSDHGSILSGLQRKHSVFCDPLVTRAFAKNAVEAAPDSQCVGTALILAEAGASKYVVASSLLMNLDATNRQPSLHVEFGDDVANLVEEVSSLTRLWQCFRGRRRPQNSILDLHDLEPDFLQMLLLSMVDVRAIFITLADRLQAMRTLGTACAPAEQRATIAHQTLQIFAPLAGRLGICSWKAELEDLCFLHLCPAEHQKIEAELSRGSRGLSVTSALSQLDAALQRANVRVQDLSGRLKSCFSIYSKMRRKARPLKEIFDVCGLRVIVQDVPSCFLVLDIVHELWPIVPGKQKDYINHPKHNGYESLHTTVVGEDGFPLEVQIRTVEMHYNAELGIAAHWRYKEGDSGFSQFLSQRLEWARRALSCQTDSLNPRISPLSAVDLRMLLSQSPVASDRPSGPDGFQMDMFSLDDFELTMQELSSLSGVLGNVDLGEFNKPYESTDKCRESHVCLYGEATPFGDVKHHHGMFEVSQAMTAISN